MIWHNIVQKMPLNNERENQFNSTSATKKKKLNSMAVVRKLTIPTEWPLLVGKVSANLCE
jgi:hypothetical protein